MLNLYLLHLHRLLDLYLKGRVLSKYGRPEIACGITRFSRCFHNKDDCNSFKPGGQASERKKKTAAHGDTSRRVEEDIEVCSRSIDLWGTLFIDYYIVACQAFFLIFLICFIFLKNLMT